MGTAVALRHSGTLEPGLSEPLSPAGREGGRGRREGGREREGEGGGGRGREREGGRGREEGRGRGREGEGEWSSKYCGTVKHTVQKSLQHPLTLCSVLSAGMVVLRGILNVVLNNPASTCTANRERQASLTFTPCENTSYHIQSGVAGVHVHGKKNTLRVCSVEVVQTLAVSTARADTEGEELLRLNLLCFEAPCIDIVVVKHWSSFSGRESSSNSSTS